MSKRLQVLLPDPEMSDIQRLAKRERLQAEVRAFIEELKAQKKKEAPDPTEEAAPPLPQGQETTV